MRSRSSATTTTSPRSHPVHLRVDDTRDLVPGPDPRETGADDDEDGFDGFQTCT